MNCILSRRNTTTTTLLLILCKINYKALLSAYSYTATSKTACCPNNHPFHFLKINSYNNNNNQCNCNIRSISRSSRLFSSSSSSSNNKNNEIQQAQLQTIQPRDETEEENEEPSSTHIVKKSRFVSYAYHISSKNQIPTILSKIKQEHIKSRHICYAYVLGDDTSNNYEERAIDDGEPVGTAGMPILGAIKGEQLVDTCCFVVRYFGGIKLGGGGLIRAYGASARLILRDLPKVTYIPKTTITLHTIPMKYIGSIYTLIQRYDSSSCAIIQHDGVEEEYTDEGDIVVLQLLCSIENTEELCRLMKDLTRGEVDIQVG